MFSVLKLFGLRPEAALWRLCLIMLLVTTGFGQGLTQHRLSLRQVWPRQGQAAPGTRFELGEAKGHFGWRDDQGRSFRLAMHPGRALKFELRVDDGTRLEASRNPKNDAYWGDNPTLSRRSWFAWTLWQLAFSCLGVGDRGEFRVFVAEHRGTGQRALFLSEGHGVLAWKEDGDSLHLVDHPHHLGPKDLLRVDHIQVRLGGDEPTLTRHRGLLFPFLEHVHPLLGHDPEALLQEAREVLTWVPTKVDKGGGLARPYRSLSPSDFHWDTASPIEGNCIFFRGRHFGSVGLVDIAQGEFPVAAAHGEVQRFRWGADLHELTVPWQEIASSGGISRPVLRSRATCLRRLAEGGWGLVMKRGKGQDRVAVGLVRLPTPIR